eukprot:NODE_239_length_11955_cov_0.931174.p8 type:complete len:162 gc:universal NODE_239_length_11955_cov_0.931174:659-1144(+)
MTYSKMFYTQTGMILLYTFILAIKFRCLNNLKIVAPNEQDVWKTNQNMTIKWTSKHDTFSPVHILLLQMPANQTDTPYNRLLPDATQFLADPLYTNDTEVSVKLKENLPDGDRYYVRVLYMNKTDKDAYYSCSPFFKIDSLSASSCLMNVMWSWALILFFQ